MRRTEPRGTFRRPKEGGSARQAGQPGDGEDDHAGGGDRERLEAVGQAAAWRTPCRGASRTRSPRPLGYPSAVLWLLTRVDRAGLEAVAALRTAWLTPVMILASAWWVKGLVFVAAGAAADLSRRPRRAPTTAVMAAGAYLIASLLASAAKAVTGRERPPVGDPGLAALVHLPADASFPSGHAATAFAAAGVVAIRYPALRIPLLGLAALIALSRVYLGVHYPLDVLAGAALGLAIAWAVTATASRVPATA